MVQPYSLRRSTFLISCAVLLVFLLSLVPNVKVRAATTTSLAGARPANSPSSLMPPLWGGQNCDTNHDPGSHVVGTFQGISSCIGPTSNPDPDIPEYLGGKPILLEWECVELVMRYMLLVDGITPYISLGGKDVVPNYPGGHGLVVEDNPAIGIMPQPGDIISFGPVPKNPNGHVAIVASVNLDSSGTGTIGIFQQNFILNNGTPVAFLLLNVNNWNITNTSPTYISTGLGQVTEWLHSTYVVTTTQTHNPVTIDNVDGHMEAFQVGSNGQLYHNWEDLSGNWSGWQSLGGNWPGQPAVAVDANGRVNIFIVGNLGPTGATLFHAWQQNPGDSSSYTGWQPMAGNWPIGTPAVTQNLNGGLEVFMRGLDSNLYHAHEAVPGAGDNNYTTWQPMGDYGWNTDPVVANNQDGTMQVFMVGGDTQLYYDQENPDSTWSGWQSLGGSWPREPAVTLNDQGELEVFISGNQGPNGATLFHSWQSSPGSSTWVMNQSGGWYGLSGTWSAGIPTVAKNVNNTMDVFLPCFGNLPPLCHDYEAPNGGWSGQQAIRGEWPGDASSTINLPGGIELFMLGTTGQVYHAWQNNAGDSSSYSNWYTLGTPQ